MPRKPDPDATPRGAGRPLEAGERRKRRGEILLADDEHAIIEHEVAEVGETIGGKARDLLLDWARRRARDRERSAG